MFPRKFSKEAAGRTGFQLSFSFLQAKIQT